MSAAGETPASPIAVQLTEADIPGASLDEPLEVHNVQALKWWLLCRGVKLSASTRKKDLIERIRKAKDDNTPVIDIDGSYLRQKQQRLHDLGVCTAPLELPSVPPTGWEVVSTDNYKTFAEKIPKMMPGTVYTYLAQGVGRSCNDGKAFRALSRGYTHWASGRIEHIAVNTCNPDYCHVKCTMKPSMKQGTYHIYLLLKCDGDLAKIESASCECAAGKSASCTHVSALLHALVAMTPAHFPSSSFDDDEVEDTLPVTSYLCQWKVPRKRKESSLQMSEASFEKHVYGRTKKVALSSLEEFDPRPPEYRGTARVELETFLKKVRGKGLGVSFLFDESTCVEKEGASLVPTSTHFQSQQQLQQAVSELKSSLHVSADRAREIERNTREQRHSSEWYSVRKYRLTASHFGEIYRLKSDTPPGRLVLQLLQSRQFTTPALEWGVKYEPIALQAYVEHQHRNGHSELTVSKVGFLVCTTAPFLGASPDGGVYDPSTEQPYGFVEIKCPYSKRELSPIEACATGQFYCTLEAGEVSLRRTSNYFCQVQGQMAIGERPWCDFVVYTLKGISVQRISFDPAYWDGVLTKLTEFYDKCLGPEIVSPLHALGLPVRDLRDH